MSILLQALKSIDPDDPGNRFGICSTLNGKLLCLGMEANNAHRMAFSIAPKTAPFWAEFSGDKDYPVPSPDQNLSAEDYYYNCSDRWDKNTAYGQSRRRLLDFMIKVTELKIWMRDTLRNLPPDYTSKFGICSYLTENAPDNIGETDWLLCKSIYYQLFRSWNLFTGNLLYPVPHPFMAPKIAYQRTPAVKLWSHTHSYGQNRWALIGHMIKELSDDTP